MPTPTQCPECGHPRVAVFPDNGTIYCPACGSQGPATTPDSPAEQVRAQALGLAEQLREQADMDAIVRDWPTPIGHELTALYQLLRDNKTDGVFYQLRDLSEVLIKLPVVILARDLIDYAARSHQPIEVSLGKQTLPVVEYIRGTLFGRSPSAGQWLELLRELARAAYGLLREPSADETPPLLAPSVVGLVYDLEGSPLPRKPRPTRLYHALEDLAAWRNEAIGHGGFRPDPKDQLATLRRYARIPRPTGPGVDRRGTGPGHPDGRAAADGQRHLPRRRPGRLAR